MHDVGGKAKDGEDKNGRCKGKKGKRVRSSTTRPVEAGTMVKANPLPAHPKILTVGTETASSGASSERRVANVSKPGLAALLVVFKQARPACEHITE